MRAKSQACGNQVLRKTRALQLIKIGGSFSLRCRERAELKISSRRYDSSMQRRHNRDGSAVGPLWRRLRCARRDRQNRDSPTTSASERRRGPESSSKSQSESMDVRASPRAWQPARRTSCLGALGSRRVPLRCKFAKSGAGGDSEVRRRQPCGIALSELHERCVRAREPCHAAKPDSEPASSPCFAVRFALFLAAFATSPSHT